MIGGFFTLTAWLIVEGIGSANLVSVVGSLANPDGSPAPETMIYALSDRYGGASLTLAISLLFVTSIFAAMQAFHNVIARYFFALGREGLLFPSLGQTHPRYQSPHLGSLLQSLLTGVTIGAFALAQIDPVLGLFQLARYPGHLGIDRGNGCGIACDCRLFCSATGGTAKNSTDLDLSRACRSVDARDRRITNCELLGLNRGRARRSPVPAFLCNAAADPNLWTDRPGGRSSAASHHPRCLFGLAEWAE